jgi:hypothetical protein
MTLLDRTAGTARPVASAPGVWRSAGVRTFLIGQSCGQAADALTGAVLVLALLGRDEPVEPATLLPTLAAATVPYALVGPVAGVIADHWERRRSIVLVNVARVLCALAAGAAVIADNRWLAMGVVGVLISTARIAYTVRAAALPEIARREDIVRADAASLYVGTVTALGAGGTGAVLAAVAPLLPLALALVAATLAAVLFARLHVDLGGHGFGREVSLRDAAAAVAHVLTGEVSRWAIAVTAGNRALLGALFATTVVAIANALDDGAAGYVMTAGITGLATFAGTCASPRVAHRTSPRVLVVAAFGIPAAVLGVAVLSVRLAVTVPAVAACFFVFQIIRVVADSTVQARIPDATRGRVFAAYDVAYNLSYFGGAAVALMLGQTSDPRTALAAVALVYAGGSAVVATHDRVVVSRPMVSA